MFNPFLTTKSALDAIGEAEDSVELVFEDAANPVVLLKRTAHKLLDSALYFKTLRNVNGVLEGDQTILAAIEDLSAGVAILIDRAICRLSRKEFSPLTNTGSFQEALANAIEHGTDFGYNGSVKLTAACSQKGAVWFIDQTNKREKFITELEKKLTTSSQPVSALYTSEAGRPRGEGFHYLINRDHVQFSFEPLGENGLRVIVYKSW